MWMYLEMLVEERRGKEGRKGMEEIAEGIQVCGFVITN